MVLRSMTSWLVLAVLTLSSRAALLDAHGAPPRLVEDVDSNFRLKKGEPSFRLICPIFPADKEMLMIEWMKDNEQIEWDSRYRMSKDNRELRMKNVRLEDSGVYKCHATNGFGHRSFNFSVHVYDPSELGSSLKDKIVLADSVSPPEFLMEMTQETSSVKVNRGGKLELRCPSRGNPIPEIRWYRDNLLLSNNAPAHIASYVVDPATESHSGAYRCVVENRLGSIDAVFNVFVDDFFPFRRPPTETIGTEPIIDLYNITVKVGHTAQFQCKAKNSGNTMMIKWLKEISDPVAVKRHDPNATIISTNGTHLLVLDQTQLETVTREGNHNVYANRLVLASVTEAAAGRYICVVTSSTGHIVHKSAQLTVIAGNNISLPKEFKLVMIVTGLLIFFCIVGCAVVFLKRSQEPSSPKMMKPPPPPRIPPPAAPSSSSYTPTLNRSFNRDMEKAACSPIVLKNSMFGSKPGVAKTLDRHYLKGNRAFDEMSHVYDCGSPQPYICTPTRNHPVYVPASSQGYRTLEVYGRTHPSLYSDDYTEQKPFIDYRR